LAVVNEFACVVPRDSRRLRCLGPMEPPAAVFCLPSYRPTYRLGWRA